MSFYSRIQTESFHDKDKRERDEEEMKVNKAAKIGNAKKKYYNFYKTFVFEFIEKIDCKQEK